MGAESFFKSVDKCGTPEARQSAFDKLVEEAYYDYGHAGYTGKICEKSDFIYIPINIDVNVNVLEHHLYESNFELLFGENAKQAEDIYCDKWGPALCFDTNDATVFCGLASA